MTLKPKYLTSSKKERPMPHSESSMEYLLSLGLAVKFLNDFCDKDERQPYYDIKKHSNGSVYLTIRTQKLPARCVKIMYCSESRKSKKFFGKTRHDVTIAAAQYVKSGQF